MDQWEYLNIVIKAEDNQWVTTFVGGGRVVGIDAIWAYFGSVGWELISVAPIAYEPAVSFTSNRYEATTLFAIFKRRKVLVYYSPRPSQE